MKTLTKSSTPGRWQIGTGPDAHELSSGDLIAFDDGAGRVVNGRVEHDTQAGYFVTATDGREFPLRELIAARYKGSGQL